MTDNARQAGLTRAELQEFSLFRNSLSIAAKSDGRMQVVMSDVDLFERILVVIESALAAQSADASNAATGQGLRRDQEAAYDSIDRFLRNNLCDEDYAQYSADLDRLLEK